MAMLRNNKERYGAIARLFHGAVFLTIAANLALGFLTEEVETGEGRFAALHATLGILTLLLLIGRVVWRFVDPPPPMAVGTPLERIVAHAGHLGLYGLAFLVAVSGWYAASYEGGRIDLIGGMALPALAAGVAPAPATGAPREMLGEHEEEMARALREHDDGEDEDEDEAGELWEEVHEWGAWALLALIALHAAAALLHLKRKDGTWERMFG